MAPTADSREQPVEVRGRGVVEVGPLRRGQRDHAAPGPASGRGGTGGRDAPTSTTSSDAVRPRRATTRPRAAAPPPPAWAHASTGSGSGWAFVAVAVVPDDRRREEEVGHGEHDGGRALRAGRGRRPSTRVRASSLSRIGWTPAARAGPSVVSTHSRRRPPSGPRRRGARVARGSATSAGGTDPSVADHERPRPRPGRGSRRWSSPADGVEARGSPACCSTASRSSAASPPRAGRLKRSASCFHALGAERSSCSWSSSRARSGAP